jgi:rRNA maturation protein Nop10
MATHILKCETCSSYGLNEKCSCGGKRIDSKPPKYSPDDRWAELKRQAKKEQGIY